MRILSVNVGGFEIYQLLFADDTALSGRLAGEVM